MYKSYVALSDEAEELLLQINSIYLANNFDDTQTSYKFNELYRDERSNTSKPVENQLNALAKAGYITSSDTPIPTELGFHYRYCQFLYWKHKCIVPASISLVVSITANVIIYWLGLK